VKGGDLWRRPRRPGFTAVAVRWRIELATATGAALLVHFTGPTFAGMVATAAAAAAVVAPPVREAAVRAYQLVALPHRVRKALAEAGTVDSNGNLPWILYARSAGPNAIRVEIKLRAGVTYDDLYFAAPDIRTACAALDARVFLHAYRSDRARVFLIRPRWGLLR
jgi:hypothetical protein